MKIFSPIFPVSTNKGVECWVFGRMSDLLLASLRDRRAQLHMCARAHILIERAPPSSMYCTTRTLYSTTVNVVQYAGRGAELAHKCPDFRWRTGTCPLPTLDSFIDMHFYDCPPQFRKFTFSAYPNFKLQEQTTPIRFVSLALLKREPNVAMWMCLRKSEWEEMRESSKKQR